MNALVTAEGKFSGKDGDVREKKAISSEIQCWREIAWRLDFLEVSKIRDAKQLLGGWMRPRGRWTIAWCLKFGALHISFPPLYLWQVIFTYLFLFACSARIQPGPQLCCGKVKFLSTEISSHKTFGQPWFVVMMWNDINLYSLVFCYVGIMNFVTIKFSNQILLKEVQKGKWQSWF